MKKIFLISFTLFILLAPFAAFAQTKAIEEKTGKVLEDILPKDIVEPAGNQVPKGNLKTEILPFMIKTALAIVGSVSFLAFVYSGIMLIISQGNEEEITKFKNMLIWAIVGLLFVTTAYALVRGILKLSFES